MNHHARSPLNLTRNCSEYNHCMLGMNQEQGWAWRETEQGWAWRETKQGWAWCETKQGWAWCEIEY